MANKYLDYTGLQHVINKVKALIKVTGVKGNAESSYRTGNVNLTAANVGAVATSGNETVAGNKTFTGLTTIEATSNVRNTIGQVITANANGVIQSPIPKYIWHDVLAFNRATTPKYYTTTDGTTWTEATLDKRLFIHKEAWGTINILDSSISGSRWVWIGGGLAYCSATWLVIGVAYANPISKFDVLLETSSGSDDTATWTTLASATGISVNKNPIWIRTSSPSTNNIRLTITRNSASASTTTLPIVSIRWLTTRWGGQGKGSEFEYPYQWNEFNTIFPIANNTSDLGGTSYKWKNVYATNFIGALKGNADTATNATKVNNHTVNSDVPANAVFKIKNTAHFYTVGTGCEYATINDALAVANADGGKSTILIMAGKYYEEISLLPANDITLIGLGNVSITGNGTYPEGCLNVVGKFQAHNIIFETLATSNGYAFHHEDMLYETSNCGQKFVNCTFYALGNSAVGLGIGNNTIEFINCTFYSGSSGNHAIYAHNSGSNTGKIGNLVVTNCTVQGSVRIDNLASLASTDNQLYVKMVGNSDIEGFTYYDYSQTLNYFPTGTTVQLSNASVGNNLNVLNRVRNEISADGSRETVNPVSDLNNFFTGIASFSAGTTNLPSNDWWLVMSGGINGTTIQVAYSLWNNQVPKTRYCAGGTWSAWANLKTS